MTARRTDPAPAEATAEERSGRGFETVLIAVYAIFAISATARSLVQVMRDLAFAPVAYILSLLAAITYIAVAVAMVRHGKHSLVARNLCIAELAGVLIVGVLTLVDPALFPDATVWGHFGQDYGFVPLVLPIVALLYMRRAGRERREGEPAGPVA